MPNVSINIQPSLMCECALMCEVMCELMCELIGLIEFINYAMISLN